MYKSPSVNILESTSRSSIVNPSQTSVALVGFSTKGPIGVPTLTESIADFINKFGTANTNAPMAHLLAKRAFRQTNKIYFTRLASDAATAAAVKVVSVNEENVDSAYITYTSADFSLAVLDTTVTIDGGTGINLNVSSGTSKADVLSYIARELRGIADVTDISDESNEIIKVSSKKFGDNGSVSVTGDTTDNVVEETTSPTALATLVDANKWYDITAKEKGTSTELISVVKSSYTEPVNGTTIHKIEVYYNGTLKETFDNLSLSSSDDNYFIDVIGDTASGSEIIEIEEDTGGGSSEVFLDGTYYLGAGQLLSDGTYFSSYDDGGAISLITAGSDGLPIDGTSPDALAISSLFATALSTSGELSDKENYDFHILATPDSNTNVTQDAAIALCESRKDCFYIIDSPMSLTVTNVIDWHNGNGNGRYTSLNTGFGAVYYPWLKDYDTETKNYIWAPPSVFLTEKFIEIDNDYGSFYAPAGNTRGIVSAFDYELSPKFSERESLLGDTNAVNPIVNSTAKGLTIYGQKTTLRDLNSPFNRINVRRVVIEIKKLLVKALDDYKFELNRQETWARAKGSISKILRGYVKAGGLESFTVAVNAPEGQATDIMQVAIELVPESLIERIQIYLNVSPAGTTLSES